jgi:hypothetical protein
MVDSGLIGNYVRNWLHYDNLASSFYKQSMSARKLKDDYESKVVTHLLQSGNPNVIIQINGGRIHMADDRKPHQLSLAKIEELLHSYYRSQNMKDETLDIMTFIRGNRGYDIKKILKKNNITSSAPQAALPAPPPISQLM